MSLLLRSFAHFPTCCCGPFGPKWSHGRAGNTHTQLTIPCGRSKAPRWACAPDRNGKPLETWSHPEPPRAACHRFGGAKLVQTPSLADSTPVAGAIFGFFDIIIWSRWLLNIDMVPIHDGSLDVIWNRKYRSLLRGMAQNDTCTPKLDGLTSEGSNICR